MRISVTEASTVTDHKSNFHLSLADLLAHSFDLADAVQILDWAWRCAGGHEDNPINGFRGLAFAAIKGEVPPLATEVAVADTKIAIPENA